MLPKYLKRLIEIKAKKQKLDPALVTAIVMVESGGNRHAIRYEPQYRWVTSEHDMLLYAQNIGTDVKTERSGQMHSWGLMQIMGATAREMGFRGWFPELCENWQGLNWGTEYLRKKADEYHSIEEIAAAYNAGSVRYEKSGSFVNQRYVDKVFQWYRKFQEG